MGFVSWAPCSDTHECESKYSHRWAVTTFVSGTCTSRDAHKSSSRDTVRCVEDSARFTSAYQFCASACGICDKGASTGTVRRSYCSGIHNRSCVNCSAAISTGIRSAARLIRFSFPLSGGRSMAQGSRRICGCARQSMKFRTLAVILMSVCQAPSESSFDELRLHELCTSIKLRLLLL